MVTLDELTVVQAPIGRAFDLARSVEVHVLGNTHFGERAVPLAGVTLPAKGNGAGNPPPAPPSQP
jgi:hypothetical protein